MNFQSMPHSGIQTLRPYQAGKSVEALAAEKGFQDIIKLASNENPLGCSPQVLHYLKNLNGDALAMYPHPHQHPLRDALAQQLQQDRDSIVVSNGSDALFTLLLNICCLHRNKHLLTHDYAFASYAIQAQTYGIAVQSIPLKADLVLDVEDLIAACSPDTGIIMFANPNNPTGTKISIEAIEHLLHSVSSEVMVLVDEAYYEFAYTQNKDSALPLLQRYPNLVISRTFSKIYGLADLRLGYAIAHPDFAELLWRVQLPFAVSGLALEAGLRAMSDKDFIRQTLVLNRQEMMLMRQRLEALGLQCLPSFCNFISFHCQRPASEVYESLLNDGIITRPLQAYGLPETIRVSIGTATQNLRFFESIKRFYEETST